MLEHEGARASASLLDKCGEALLNLAMQTMATSVAVSDMLRGMRLLCATLGRPAHHAAVSE